MFSQTVKLSSVCRDGGLGWFFLSHFSYFFGMALHTNVCATFNCDCDFLLPGLAIVCFFCVFSFIYLFLLETINEHMLNAYYCSLRCTMNAQQLIVRLKNH